MVDTEMYSEIQRRKRAGYSQRAVARELDLDRNTIRRYWGMTDDQYGAPFYLTVTHLASNNIVKKWSQRYREWDMVLNHLALLFEGRQAV